MSRFTSLAMHVHKLFSVQVVSVGVGDGGGGGVSVVSSRSVR